MDYLEMTAPCGLDCFNCVFYLANTREQERAMLEIFSRQSGLPIEIMFCRGCRPQKGFLKLHQALFNRDEPCPAYKCSTEKQVDFCYECSDFPCDALHPYADRADKVPHNTKVFNLCLIKKMGLENWAREKAAQVREKYNFGWWSL